MATQGLSGFEQSTSDSAAEDLYVASDDGGPLMGVYLKAGTQNIVFGITGLLPKAPGEEVTVTLTPSDGLRLFVSGKGNSGLITKITGLAAATGGTSTWLPAVV